jgi:multiple antibiotic resistance protein
MEATLTLVRAAFTSMTVPIIGGPGAMGVVIGLSTQATQWTDYIGCCLGVGLLDVLIHEICFLVSPEKRDYGSSSQSQSRPI